MMMNDQLIFEEEFDENHEYTEEEIKEYALTIDIDPENVRRNYEKKERQGGCGGGGSGGWVL